MAGDEAHCLLAKNETIRYFQLVARMRKTTSALFRSFTVKKILVPLIGDDVAPRFDLAPEALIALVDDNGIITEDRTIILDEASAETLCKLVLTEKVDVVVCCGIEDEYYNYLVWKRVQVFDSVMGPYAEQKARY